MNPAKSSNRLFPTYTGRLVDLTNLSPDDIDIRDIAHALANANRWMGHSRFPFSVAQHSVMVSMLCPLNRLWGLLHDASEAYCSDLARPIKYTQDLLGYRSLESRIMRAVCTRFGLESDEPEAVRLADLRVL